MWINQFAVESEGEFMVTFLEPLSVGAPEGALPHCCYLNTIIFYKQPYEENGKGGYVEFGRAETEWNLLGQRWTEADLGWSALAPLVQHEDAFYELTGGRVSRRDDKWFLEWSARRLSADDFRIKEKPS